MENKEFQALIESEKYAPLADEQKSTLAAIMENTARETERMIAEGTIASDIAQFTPFLMPILRKVYPALVANELLGVQPMSGPTGFIYTLTNRYLGNAANGVTGKPGVDLGGTGPSEYSKTNAATQVILVESATKPVLGEEVQDSSGNKVGTVVFVETSPHGRTLANNAPSGQTIPNTIGGAEVGGQKAELWGVLVELESNGYFVNGGFGLWAS
jgi:hypothetical protein